MVPGIVGGLLPQNVEPSGSFSEVFLNGVPTSSGPSKTGEGVAFPFFFFG
jgi:hypothetical protein